METSAPSLTANQTVAYAELFPSLGCRDQPIGKIAGAAALHGEEPDTFTLVDNDH